MTGTVDNSKGHAALPTQYLDPLHATIRVCR
jgi:hypothetical protein